MVYYEPVFHYIIYRTILKKTFLGEYIQLQA